MTSPSAHPLPDSGTDLDARYGRGGRNRGLIVVSGLIGLIALAWVAWVVHSQSTPKVTSAVVAFDVVDAHTGTMRFAVRRTAEDVKATCTLQAYAEDHTVVGESSIVVGPGPVLKQTLNATVRTERLATTLELMGCTAPGQNRPR